MEYSHSLSFDLSPSSSQRMEFSVNFSPSTNSLFSNSKVNSHKLVLAKRIVGKIQWWHLFCSLEDHLLWSSVREKK